MDNLVRLRICERLGDTLALVASGPKRQPTAAAGAPKVAEGALDVEEGAQAILALVHAPQPPLATAPTRTMTRRMTKLEEEVHRMREVLGEQRKVLGIMACDFSRFTTWMITSLSLMMDRSGVRYTSYSDFRIPYQRRTRRRTDDANTSTPQQPYP
ncbi:hypothetical protein Tco_0070147 [Tanacetum coccineum]